jgi:hypothetical protein
MAQSVLRLATDWTVRISNLGAGKVFRHSSSPTLRPTQTPKQWVPVSFPGGKEAAAWH